MFARFLLRAALSIVLPTLLCGLAAAADTPRVVILGFDGADPRLVEMWMDQGELPHLARLREEGAYAPLEPTNPPQTPVSWSSFATGMNPGKTQIFDFLKRDPSNYLPAFAMMTESKRDFLFGASNPETLGGIAALVAVFGVLALLWPTGVGRMPRLVAALVAGLAVGGGAYAAVRAYLPQEVPEAINSRQGLTMWELADAAGLRSRVIRVPATFPAEPMDRGEMLSGLGVPDMRGRVGTPAFYTSSPNFKAAEANQFSLELLSLPARRGTIETRILGPYNKPFYQYPVERRLEGVPAEERKEAKRKFQRELDDAGVPRRIDLDLRLEATDTELKIDVAGQQHTLRVGDWSDWVVLDFPVNGVVDRLSPLRGAARFKLLRLEPELELYLSPINFHPDCHPVAFSWPPDHSEELLDRFGMYKTLGWALDTWSLPSGVGDESLFLEDMNFTVDKYAEMMRGLLADDQDDLFVQIFYFPDRIGHLFWQFLDSGHPLYDEERAARYGGEVLKAYKRMDDLVGEARALAGEDALFLVCSDHGFSSFRRGVNYNNWLVEQGLLVLKGQPEDKATLEQLFDTRELVTGVDWSKTRAYAIGLGSIYVNLAGRERYGIVLPGPEYDQVRRQIKEGLEALVDPLTGERPVTQVYLREEMYTGFDPDLIPDLRAASSQNYRVSWQTSLGGFGEQLIEDNTKAWSGDHCSNDPAVVPGIFFSNRPINTEHPRMIDIMPTVLATLGIPAPPEVDGRSLR